jgi:hypothetical protein
MEKMEEVVQLWWRHGWNKCLKKKKIKIKIKIKIKNKIKNNKK